MPIDKLVREDGCNLFMSLIIGVLFSDDVKLSSEAHNLIVAFCGIVIDSWTAENGPLGRIRIDQYS